ncbi:MAG: FAD-dependent oxidoreductase [Bacteroidia bacterium]|nr:FAD-dependent oxidoreductase [Bacteroidia bacterium]
MLRPTINILSTFSTPKKFVVMGNVAVARGAVEFGVDGVFSYPGTPSTEISEVFNHIWQFQSSNENQKKHPSQCLHRIYFEYSINEKIALEKAIAFSIGNRSAMCVMKNVGMNVASDALMSIPYQSIIAPLVVVVCDDPGCHSSSNEQDSRHWGPLANVPVFNPANPAEALEMTREAFLLSAELKLPVIIRTTTRVSHSRGVVNYGSLQKNERPAHFDRLPEHINIPARTSAAHARLLNKLTGRPVTKRQKTFSHLQYRSAGTKTGIISSGVALEYVKELITDPKLVSVLNLGMIHPFPEREVLKFLKRRFSKILVLEELDPFIEDRVRVLAQKNEIRTKIFGKGFAGLSPCGEFSVDLIADVLRLFIGKGAGRKQGHLNPGALNSQLPTRPPALCAGCPHRATFYLLKLAIPREQSDLILCGDIGCFGLGALPPLRMIDTINHMGMSVSMAQGLGEAFRSAGDERKLVALVGDGTFFHSGLAALVNAVYTRANILVVIFDNRTIGMTGHQSHPGASKKESKYQEIDIPPLLRGLGIEVVESINPFELKESFTAFSRAMEHRGVSVVVAKSPCIFLPEFVKGSEGRVRIQVDPQRCNTCANHEDIALACSRIYSPVANLSRARQKLLSEVSVPGDEQLCPANICNHGFFHSILEGDYRAAVEMVRDKMLFARTCGDICHRPCELFSGNQNPVPIRALKKFVASKEEWFSDFSRPVSRSGNARKMNKTVAVIGAGPAGLSAAYDLVQNGYKVEIFEKMEKAGGMVSSVIPVFRMDKKGYETEAMALRKMGVDFHFGQSLGQHFTLGSLSEKFDAVILAIGMWKPRILPLVEHLMSSERCLDALSFLKKYNSDELPAVAGEQVVLVIGGGNSAMDAARSARKRFPEGKVIVSCLEKRNQMPALEEEVCHAESEGAEILPETVLVKIEKSKRGGWNAVLESNAGKDIRTNLECDYVITAIGQESDTRALSEIGAKDFDEENRLRDGTMDKFPNVFSAGDISSGNNMSVIGAISSGKRAAVGVRKLLENYRFSYEGEQALSKLNRSTKEAVRTSGVSLSGFSENGAAAVKQQLEKFDLFQACMKCNHCIDNFGCPAMVKVDGKIVIDDARCTLCGLCIDVCPNNAISWITEKIEKHEGIMEV